VAKTCAKCAGSMAQGFIVDQGDYGSKDTAKWHGGAPNRRWWGMATDKSAMREVSTWRCTKCGFLESYAP